MRLLIAVVIALSGCSTMKPAADAGIALVEFPQCRQALEAYLPEDIEAELVIQWENIDTTFNRVIAAANGNYDMKISRAIEIANLPTTADLVEQDFMAIVERTIEYQQESGRMASPFLATCNQKTQAAWRGLRDDSNVMTVSEFLRAAAPYAKLIPMLLRNGHQFERVA